MQSKSATTWEDLKVTRQFINAMVDMGLNAPTSIQQKAVPAILAGQKVVGIAQTGTGKTAAYLLPVLLQLKFAQNSGARALVLVPTKELVIQIGKYGKQLAKLTDLRIVELFGGVGTKQQVEQLHETADVIVATPGRFMEIYLLGYIVTKNIKFLVIDEADRMLDMNFMPQLRKIFEVLPSKRQNLLFSATYSPKVEKMTNEFIDFPVKIEITPPATVSRQVTHSIYSTPNFSAKLDLLIHFLVKPGWDKVLVFARTRETVINLAKFLERKGFEGIKTIHSNKEQNSRLNALETFKSGDGRLLISTDVSARGIDIPKVTHVINFDVPVLYEEYVHRIGRTGRAFETGVAVTFVTPADEYHIAKIEGLINEKIQRESLPLEIVVNETPFEESQIMAREIDRQKRILDPTYKGAFHDRKRK